MVIRPFRFIRQKRVAVAARAGMSWVGHEDGPEREEGKKGSGEHLTFKEIHNSRFTKECQIRDHGYIS
jgi:hypothetical protein